MSRMASSARVGRAEPSFLLFTHPVCLFVYLSLVPLTYLLRLFSGAQEISRRLPMGVLESSSNLGLFVHAREKSARS